MDESPFEDAESLWEKEVIDRTPTPGHDHLYLPTVIGGLVATPRLLLRAGYRPRQYLQRGWRISGRGEFKRRAKGGKYDLIVRQSDDRGELWSIERAIYFRGQLKVEEALTNILGPMMIFTREFQQAMRLAEWCHPHPPPMDAPAVGWTDTNYVAASQGNQP